MSTDEVLTFSFILLILTIFMIGVGTTPQQIVDEKLMVNYYGISAYPRTSGGTYSTGVIDDIIDVMDHDGLNVYRMAIYYTVNTSDVITYASYFLTNCNYDLVLDLNHKYPQGTATNAQWTLFQTRCLTVLAALPGYSTRLWIEIENERTDSNLASRIQTIVTAIRTAGYTNPIVANKWTQSWSSIANISDPSNNFWSGMHGYFNENSLSYMQSQMQTGLDYGLKLICTEIGADYNEYPQFDQSEVDTTSKFLDWCYNKNVSVNIWMRYGLGNYPTYQNLGLEWPPLTTPPPESPPVPPEPLITYTVKVRSGSGGYSLPSIGTYTRVVDVSFSVTASAYEDYDFTRWLLDGVEYTTQLTAIIDGTKDRTYILQPVFTVTPGEPSDPAPPSPDPEEPESPYVEPDEAVILPIIPRDVAVVGDAKMFQIIYNQIESSKTPSFNELWRLLKKSKTPSFEDIWRQLEQVSA